MKDIKLKYQYLDSKKQIQCMRTRFLLLGLFAVLISSTIFITGCTTAPVADFRANVTYGSDPLTIRFTDLSSNNPTGWTWFFGDEDYTRSWTKMNASGGWAGRTAHSSVALANGSIILMGGDSGDLPYKNDTWKSVDNGATWTLVNVSSGWQGRYSQSTVVLPDDSIVLTGGYIFGSWRDVGDRNDTWRSTDGGATWMLMNASSGWEARSGHCSVALSDGSIVIMGGRNKLFNSFLNDVWRSTDKGASWNLLNSDPGWIGRGYFSCVAMADGGIIMIGGLGGSGQTAMLDIWSSRDKGLSWNLINASPWVDGMMYHSSVMMPDDSIVTMGGSSGHWKTEVWRSTDKGATWTRVNANPGWSSRGFPQGQTMPDGSIILMGGDSYNGHNNDTWRFNPSGSAAQNPVHTYTKPGNYSVTLQAYNGTGYDRNRKIEYIKVA